MFSFSCGSLIVSSASSAVKCVSNVSTVVNSLMTTKEVACQTTSDLHLALLMEEFPHLFEKSNLSSSVYDSPAQSDIKYCDETLSALRTPELLLQERSPHLKYTSVSSITTSEKKRVEMEFNSRSVLYDGLRTSFSGVGANYSPANVSNISPLPSSEKKPSTLETNDLERRELSVKLNFQEGSKLCFENDPIGSPSITPLPDEKETPCSKDVISSMEDAMIHSNANLTESEKPLFSSSIISKTDDRQCELTNTNASKEIEFTDSNKNDEGEIDRNEREAEEMFVAHSDYISDSTLQGQDDVEIFESEEKDRNQDRRSPEVKKLLKC